MHKHRARNLHYDLRLELDGVLKSWAIPKGPSLDPREKRLAIQVEDHPLEYGDFEGNIPEGEYGAGTVIVWDRGTWEPIDDPHEGLRQGELKVELHGEKLRGGWVLVEGALGRHSRQPQWLLIKGKDADARSRDAKNVVEQFPESVDSGQSLEETAVAPPAKKQARRSAAKERDGEGADSRAAAKPKRAATSGAKSRRKATPACHRRGAASQAATRLQKIPGAKRTDMPQSVDLQLVTMVAEPPSGNEWLSEIKLDGYRIACHLAGGKATLYSRQHQDWTARFADVASAACELPVKQAILDGEIVVFLPDGRTSFQALQNAMQEDHAANLAYVAFDLLYLDGYDLRAAALEDRKRLLADVLLPPKNPRLQYLEHIVGQADRFSPSAASANWRGSSASGVRGLTLPGAGSTGGKPSACCGRNSSSEDTPIRRTSVAPSARC